MINQSLPNDASAEKPDLGETPFERTFKTVMLIWCLALLVLLMAYAWCRSFEPPAPMALRLTIAALVTPVLMVISLIDACFGRQTGVQRFAGVAIGATAILCAWFLYRHGTPIEIASIQGAAVPFFIMRVWDSIKKRWRKRAHAPSVAQP